MKNQMKTAMSILLAMVFVFTSLSSPIKAESGLKCNMPYEQFVIFEAPKVLTPVYPFGNEYTFAEENEALEQYQDWWQAKWKQQGIIVPNLNQIHLFTQKTAQLVLVEDGGTNELYSPINIWLYLTLLANLTEGDYQTQVLDLLGLNAEADLAEANEWLYKALYWDDGLSICRPALSLWLNQNTHLSDALATKISEKYHVSVYQGVMGDEKYSAAFRSWLNDQTNHLMEDTVASLSFTQDTSLSLCTTMYMRCLWSLPFNKYETYRDTFYSRDGEMIVDYMKKEEAGGVVYHGTGFSSAIMDLQDGSYVTFVLPDPEYSIGDILGSEELFEFFRAGRNWKNSKPGRIKISVPRIDILAETHLNGLFARMGAADLFDSDSMVFSKDIVSENDLQLSTMEQYSRLIMNEDGVEAASMIVTLSSVLQIPDEEEIDFHLNRPFIFAVFSEGSIPLFMGVYRMP